MTNHEYAKLLLAQPEMPFYVSIQGESYYSPNVPRIEEGPDPIELASKLDSMYYDIREIADRKEAKKAAEEIEIAERSTLPIIKYSVAEI